MSEAEDPAEEKRSAYMKARREYAEALRVRSETEKLNPSMMKGERPKPTLGERLRRNTDDLIEAKHSYQLSQSMFGTPQTQPTPDPNRPIDALKEIANFGLRIGKKPAEIEEIIQRLTPIIVPLGSLAGDQIARESVYARAFSENKFGFPEMIQTLNSLNTIRPQSQQINIAEMMTAMTTALKTGLEVARTNNGGFDVGQIISMQQASHDRMIEAQREHFREIRELQSQQPSLIDSLKQMREVSDLIGVAPDKPEIALKKLDILAQKEEREFTRQSEASKDSRQEKMFTGIVGAIGKALESPILREAGRNLGQRLPGVGPEILLHDRRWKTLFPKTGDFAAPGVGRNTSFRRFNLNN